MKKLSIIAMVALSAIFSGCLNYYQETVLKTDGSGEMFIHYWTKVANSQDSLIVNQFGIFNPDSIASQFSSPYNTIEGIENYFDAADSTIHAKATLKFQSLDSLNHTRVFKDAKFSFIDGAPGQKVFSQYVSPMASAFGFNTQNFTVTYVYYLPGEIISHNGHELSNNKITWSYKMDEIGMGKQITATIRPFKLKETPLWIYIIASCVLAVVILFLFRKK